MKENGRLGVEEEEGEVGKGERQMEEDGEERTRVPFLFFFFFATPIASRGESMAQDKCLPVVRPLLSWRFSLINDRRSFRFNDFPPAPFLAPSGVAPRSHPSRCLSSVPMASVSVIEFLGFLPRANFLHSRLKGVR